MAENDTPVSNGDSAHAPERKHWNHLYSEIVATEICTACSACVVACPHHVIEMQDFRPVMQDLTLGIDDCVHGEKNCSLCAMACLRLDADFDARWAAWQTRDRIRDRAVRRTLLIAGPSGGHCRSDRSSPPDPVIP